MAVRWANPGGYGPDVLERVHRSLTVNLIMMPRARVQTCRRDETASAIMARNKQRFSFLPVVDDAGQILGLYRADQWFGADAPGIGSATTSNHFPKTS